MVRPLEVSNNILEHDKFINVDLHTRLFMRMRILKILLMTVCLSGFVVSQVIKFCLDLDLD